MPENVDNLSKTCALYLGQFTNCVLQLNTFMLVHWRWLRRRSLLSSNDNFVSCSSSSSNNLTASFNLCLVIFLSLSFSLPWNQSTILGYFMEQMFDIVMCLVYFPVNGILLLPFISICIHYRTFYQIIRNLVDHWNDSTKNHQFNNIEIDRKFICDLIQFDISFKK